MAFYLFFCLITPADQVYQPSDTLNKDNVGVYHIEPVMSRLIKKTSDPWFSEDKFYHLSASTALPVITYNCLIRDLESNPTKGKLYAVSLTAFIGLGKEFYDKKKKNFFSWKDIFWDGVGVTISWLLFMY